MAWTFIEQLPVERTPRGAYLYSMSVTDGTETRREFYKSLVELTNPQLAAVRDAVLFRLNNPPPQDTTIKEIRAKLLEINAASSGITNAIKAAKWDAVWSYYQTIVGGDQ